jgi:transposase
MEKPAQPYEVRLEVVKSPESTRGFVLLPKRWVVERSFAWATRFRRLAKDYERLLETVKSLHILAFVCLMLSNLLCQVHNTLLVRFLVCPER